MKKILVALIFAIFTVTLVSCDTEPQLEAPQNLRFDDYLTWDEVENAQEYLIIVNDDTEYIHEEEYLSLVEEGTYEIEIIARASGYENSPKSETFTITIDYNQDANINVDVEGNLVTWNEVEDATHYFVMVNDNIIRVDDNGFSLSNYESGEYNINVFAVFPDGSNTELSDTVTRNITN